MGLALEDFSFEDGKWFLKYSENHIEKIKASIDSNLSKEREFIK